MRYRVFISMDTAESREVGGFAFNGSLTTDGADVPENDPRFNEVHTIVGSVRDLPVDADDVTLYASGAARDCGFPAEHLQNLADIHAFLTNIEEGRIGVHDDHEWYEGSNCSITLVRKYAPDEECAHFIPGTDDDGNSTRDRVVYRRTIYSFIGISKSDFDMLVFCLKSPRGKGNIDCGLINPGKVQILMAQHRAAVARVRAAREGQDIAAAQMSRAMRVYNDAVRNRTAVEARLNAALGGNPVPTSAVSESKV